MPGIARWLFVACFASCSHPAQVTAPYNNDAVPSSATIRLTGLLGPVDVIRDREGMVHIYAAEVADAIRVEGYQMARDRTVQLELLRRSAEGRVAEVAGGLNPAFIDGDIAARTLGLKRIADTIYQALPPDSESRLWLDAFADGISQFNARIVSGDERLPDAMVGIPETAFEPWTAADVLAVGRYQAQLLSYTAVEEIAESEFVQKTLATFDPGSTDPSRRKRAGLLRDLMNFAPIDPTSVAPGFAAPAKAIEPGTRPFQPRTRAALPLSRELFAATAGWRAAQLERTNLARPGATGSNAWVVSPRLSATGHVLLASDPHLALSEPPIFWMVHLNVRSLKHPKANLNVSGLAFPGIPGVVLGFNDHFAWAATNALYDVTDVYREQLTPDGSGVVWNGQSVAIEHHSETILVSGGNPVTLDLLVVPHHGPLIPNIVNHQVVPPDPAVGALSVRWTGLEPSDELSAAIGLMRAQSVDDAKAALGTLEVGAQNWLFGDTSGNISYNSRAKIPVRSKGAFAWNPSASQWQLPCLVLPGDGSAEWTGMMTEASIPQLKNPAQGYIASANNDPIGVTFDDDPTNDLLPGGAIGYLGCWFDPGVRARRIKDRIAGIGHLMSLDDMAAIQSDARSGVGALLAPTLLQAIDHAEQERAQPGTHPDLTAVVGTPRYTAAQVAGIRDLIQQWGAQTDFEAASGVSDEDGTLSSDPKEALASHATLLFNAWQIRLIGATLDDEMNAIGIYQPGTINFRRFLIRLLTSDPKILGTYDATTNDSILFDDLNTPNVESRDERSITSLLDALDYLTKKLGADSSTWRWGKLHTLRLGSLVSFWSQLSIPNPKDPIFANGFPRHGDGFNLDVAAYDSRPATFDQLSFEYHDGPAQRFVIDLDPKGPIARNALPGGEIWDNVSPHFRDEAELWRRNQNHAVAFDHAAVLQVAESRVVYEP